MISVADAGLAVLMQPERSRLALAYAKVGADGAGGDGGRLGTQLVAAEDVIDEVDDECAFFAGLGRIDCHCTLGRQCALQQMQTLAALLQLTIDLVLKLTDGLIGIPPGRPRCGEQTGVLLQRQSFHRERHR